MRLNTFMIMQKELDLSSSFCFGMVIACKKMKDKGGSIYEYCYVES